MRVMSIPQGEAKRSIVIEQAGGQGVAQAMGGNLGHASGLAEGGHVGQQPGIFDGPAIGPEPEGGVGRAGGITPIAG